MFEKEAEEIANKKLCSERICYNHCNFNSPKHHRCGEWHRIYECAKESAEFGYNKGQSDQLVYKQYQLRKANGWHKQEADDIYDLIAEDWSVRYFICIMKDKSRVTAIGNCDEGCNGEVSVNLFFEHDDEKYYLDDIVWWKEIVLPKESK